MLAGRAHSLKGKTPSLEPRAVETTKKSFSWGTKPWVQKKSFPWGGETPGTTTTITPNLQGCKQGGIIDPLASNRIWQQQPSSTVLARTYKGEANETGSSGLCFFILTNISLLLQVQDARAKRSRARCLEISHDAGTGYYGEGLP